MISEFLLITINLLQKRKLKYYIKFFLKFFKKNNNTKYIVIYTNKTNKESNKIKKIYGMY